MAAEAPPDGAAAGSGADSQPVEAVLPPAPPPTLLSRARAALVWLADAAYTHWFILGLGFFIGLAAAVPQARSQSRNFVCAPRRRARARRAAALSARAAFADARARAVAADASTLSAALTQRLSPLALFCAFQVAKTKGNIRAEYSIKYAAVIVIFLLSGAGLKTRVLLDAASAWRVHLVRVHRSAWRRARSADVARLRVAPLAADADAVFGGHPRHRLRNCAWALENVAE